MAVGERAVQLVKDVEAEFIAAQEGAAVIDVTPTTISEERITPSKTLPRSKRKQKKSKRP